MVKAPPAREKEQSSGSRKINAFIIALSVVTLLVVLNFFTGIVSYSFMYARCSQPPVTASKFMAGYNYYLPGQSGYGPSMFTEYYCSEQEAGNAGFHPSVR